MSNPDIPNRENQPSTSESKTPKPAITDVTTAVRALLQSGEIKDEANMKFIADAAAFLEAPTNNLSDLQMHVQNIGDVLSDFMTEDLPYPPEIDDMHHQLLILLGRHHLDWTMRYATALKKGYGDEALFHELAALVKGQNLS